MCHGHGRQVEALWEHVTATYYPCLAARVAAGATDPVDPPKVPVRPAQQPTNSMDQRTDPTLDASLSCWMADHVARLRMHCVADSRIQSVPLFLKRQCGRTLPQVPSIDWVRVAEAVGARFEVRA